MDTARQAHSSAVTYHSGSAVSKLTIPQNTAYSPISSQSPHVRVSTADKRLLIMSRRMTLTPPLAAQPICAYTGWAVRPEIERVVPDAPLKRAARERSVLVSCVMYRADCREPACLDDEAAAAAADGLSHDSP